MTPRELKALRAKMGWSQGRMAEELGISTSTVSHWEQGVQKISRPAARLLELLRQDPHKGK